MFGRRELLGEFLFVMAFHLRAVLVSAAAGRLRLRDHHCQGLRNQRTHSSEQPQQLETEGRTPGKQPQAGGPESSYKLLNSS